MTEYLDRFSQIAGNLINCGPVLNWLELDNRGRRLLVPDGDNCPINTPAVAAAYSVKRYTAQAGDEISFEASINDLFLLSIMQRFLLFPGITKNELILVHLSWVENFFFSFPSYL